jgi:glutathione S-transferase
MISMKLYFAPGACSLAPHIVLREVGAQFAMERVDLKAHKLGNGADYYTINPRGSVPVLELDNGERLSEGPVICQYLADQAGNTQLMPAAGTMQRYRVAEWQNYITSELHKSFSPIFGSPALDDAGKSAFGQRLRAAAAEEVRLGLRAAHRQAVSDRGRLHRGGCVSVRGEPLGDAYQAGSLPGPECHCVCCPSRRASSGQGGAARRRPGLIRSTSAVVRTWREPRGFA